ncbi:MAG: cytochrome c oxidase subunit 3 [Saprospiraceae bacterium]|jgi:cytochrome c oxidase subunit 3|nr:cytochrome c oxidase subunit 3 [Saprospiraceae bacterium]
MATETVMEHDVDKHDDGGNAWSGAKSPFKASYGKLMMWYFLLSDAFTFAGFLIAYGAIRFSSPTWPVPDFVFSTAPFGVHDAPLIFVTIMSFLLIISSVTMVRAVQEGHRENKNGVVFWMLLTIVGGAGFLGCQAWEWNNLIGTEHMTVNTNPFGSHEFAGEYLDEKGGSFDAGDSYLIHGHTAENGEFQWDQRPVRYETGETTVEQFGPKSFGALFFFITGFHGFHVFSGVVFLLIICINVGSGLYVERKNGYEMVEKIGLYWHFVDLVWVFVFLVFYLL